MLETSALIRLQNKLLKPLSNYKTETDVL